MAAIENLRDLVKRFRTDGRIEAIVLLRSWWRFRIIPSNYP